MGRQPLGRDDAATVVSVRRGIGPGGTATDRLPRPRIAAEIARKAPDGCWFSCVAPFELKAGMSAALRMNVDTDSYLQKHSMNLQIAKWGNGLALRIPADVARRFDLHEGDTVDARLTADGALSIRQGSWNRAATASENEVARELLPLGTAVISDMRQASRY